MTKEEKKNLKAQRQKLKSLNKKKKKGQSVQDLLGIKTFTKHGLKVGRNTFVLFSVVPTNISVLSYENIEIKINHLMMVLSAVPDIEVNCTDAAECFDTNKSYLILNSSTISMSKVPPQDSSSLLFAAKMRPTIRC